MIEAAKTTASAGEIWVICVVAVSCLAFWLGMVSWADRHPIWRGRQVPQMPGPVLGGIHVAGGGRSVAPNRAAPAILTSDDPAGSQAAGSHATRPRPAGSQAAGQAGAVTEMPAQRAGDADRPERSGTGRGTASQDGEEGLGG